MSKKYVHREPLTSDIIFKAVFGQDTSESKVALIELLNIVLERSEDPIVSLTYVNPFSIAEAEKEKTIIMDIKVESSRGELIDIEMQLDSSGVYADRSVYYGCTQLSKGLERGEDYDKIKKSIVISFLKNKLFPQDVPIHSVFTLRERSTGHHLSDVLEMHYIELGKINWKSRDVNDLSPLEQLGAYICCSGNQQESVFVEALVRKGERVISMADTVLRKISEEERLKILREDRETARIFARLEKAYAREEGLKEGISLRNKEIVLRMLKKGMDNEFIKEITGVENEMIEEIKNSYECQD